MSTTTEPLRCHRCGTELPGSLHVYALGKGWCSDACLNAHVEAEEFVRQTWASPATKPSPDKAEPLETLDIVFDGPPGPTSGRFVDVERDGKSIRFGKWVKRPDGFWALRFKYPRPGPDKAEPEDILQGDHPCHLCGKPATIYCMHHYWCSEECLDNRPVAESPKDQTGWLVQVADGWRNKANRRANTINQLEIQVAERTRRIEELEAQLAERDERIKQLEDLETASDDAILKLSKHYKDYPPDYVAQLQQEIDERNVRIRDLEAGQVFIGHKEKANIDALISASMAWAGEKYEEGYEHLLAGTAKTLYSSIKPFLPAPVPLSVLEALKEEHASWALYMRDNLLHGDGDWKKTKAAHYAADAALRRLGEESDGAH